MDQPACFKDGKTEGIIGLKARYKSAAHTARQISRLSESETQAVDREKLTCEIRQRPVYFPAGTWP